MIVINRFQLAGRSSMELIYRLLTEPCTEIGIVLGVNEMQPRLDMAVNMWDAIVENLKTAARFIILEVPGNTETGRMRRMWQKRKLQPHACEGRDNHYVSGL